MSECSNYCSIKNTTHQATQHYNAVLQIVDGVVFRYCRRTPRVNYREVAKLELEFLRMDKLWNPGLCAHEADVLPLSCGLSCALFIYLL